MTSIVFLDATGGVYKRQGHNLDDVMSHLYEAFLIYVIFTDDDPSRTVF